MRAPRQRLTPVQRERRGPAGEPPDDDAVGVQMAIDLIGTGDPRAHPYLRWSGVVERRTRPDGVYEWYSTRDGPLEVGERLTAG